MDAVGAVLAVGVVERRLEGGDGAFEEGVVVARGAGRGADADDGLQVYFGGGCGRGGVHHGPVVGLLAAHAEANDGGEGRDFEMLC